MRSGTWASVLVVALLATPVSSASAPDPQAILAASDAIRNPDRPFGITVTLTEYRNGVRTEVTTLAVYSKADPGSGRFNSLVQFVAPPRDANKLMLKAGNDMWFYDPESKASIRLSPQQRLLGQAANGDVVTVNLARDYEARLEREEEILDGDRQQRRCYRLVLTATSPAVTYHRIEHWIEATTNRPVKARFYAESGGLLKTAFYRRYQHELGVERPTETVIIDGADSGWITVMRYADYASRDVPDAWFQRDYLPRFRPAR